MKPVPSRFCLLMLTTIGAMTVNPVAADEAHGPDPVTILEVPDGGIQPQAMIDDQGVIHLHLLQRGAGRR